MQFDVKLTILQHLSDTSPLMLCSISLILRASIEMSDQDDNESKPIELNISQILKEWNRKEKK